MAKAVLTVTAENPALTYAVTGLVDGDPASVVSGTAALTTTATPTSPLGSYPITFSTKGLAANYSFTYVAGTLTILPPCVIGTTTTLVINPSTNLVAGEPITLTATVTPASGTSTPSGTLTFKDPAGGGVTVSLDGTGKAALTGVVPAAGKYSIFASYSGATGFARSISDTITRTVIKP